MSTLTKSQKTIVIGSFLGWSLDGYDIVLMLLVISSISPIFFPSEDPIISLLGTYASYSITLIMRPFGAAIFGIYGDKFGRKKSMIITILGFSIATFVTGLLPTYAMVGVMAPILLIVTRMAQGIFAGGEWGSGAVITMESIPKHKRGFFSGLLQSGFSFGFVLASIGFQIITIAFVGEEFLELGWRVLFFTGIIPGLVALFIRLRMDESTLWLEKQKAHRLEKTPLRKIVFGKEHKRSFFLCVFVMTGLVYMYHGSVGFLPTFLQQFTNIERTDLAPIMIFATLTSWLGMIFTGWLSQKVGRKKSMIFFAMASIALVIPIAYGILDEKISHVILFVMIYAFVVSTASGPIPAFFSERFPTEVRNSAAGFAYNGGLIVGSWAPLIALSFISMVETELIPVALGLNIIIGALILVAGTLLNPETKDLDLS
jgi:MFS family permease